MKIRLIIPPVNAHPTTRPRECRHCQSPILHRHAVVTKPIKDQRLRQAVAIRYKCAHCKRTFRHYPVGVSAQDQSRRTVVLAALMYGLGLSCSVASHLLRAMGADIGKMTVWRDAQQAGQALRSKRPAGRVRVLGADETVFRVKGQEVVVRFLTDAQSGRTFGFEILAGGDGQSFIEWLEPYPDRYGVEVLVSDDNDAYGVVAKALRLDHQLCITHVRRYVSKRAKSILAQAEQEYSDDEQLQRLKQDLQRVRELVGELPEDGWRMGKLHRQYLWADAPKPGERASAGYRMRLLTLELWEKWDKLRLYLRRAELGLDGQTTALRGRSARARSGTRRCEGTRALRG